MSKPKPSPFDALLRDLCRAFEAVTGYTPPGYLLQTMPDPVKERANEAWAKLWEDQP